MKKSGSPKEKLQYAFDNVMSKGPIAAVILLIIVSIIIIFFFASIIAVFNIQPNGEGNVGFVESFWMSLMRTLDPGTMGDDEGWPFRILMLLVTSYGIVMLSTFIGIMSNAILNKVQTLRKGRSKVLEKNHILILGWSPKIHTIISELVIANENQEDPVIVVLAKKDKLEMEDEIREKIRTTKNTKVICRTGNPIDVSDLEIANPYETKSIIIMDQETENSDAEIIKIILAVVTNPKRRKEPYHITAEIEAQKNLEVARMVGKDEVELILSDDFISRIMVQTSKQSGLSVVYTDLLDFEGDEIYFKEEEKLFGKTFHEALFCYEDSAVIGLQLPDNSVVINPDPETIIEKGTKIIAVSEDDDTVIYSKNNEHLVQKDFIVEVSEKGKKHEKVLILGWNRRTGIIIRELSKYMHPDSEINVVADMSEPVEVLDKVRKSFPEVSISFQSANTTDKDLLANLNIHTYDHLLLLSYQDHLDPQEADAKTLITLLHLRNMATSIGKKLNIVSEMLDLRNRELAKVTDADDFIVSDNIISLLMSQVSENKFLMRVFEILFEADGSEVYLKPAKNYIKTGEEMNFYTILESAQRKGEVAIGYRRMEFHRNEEKTYGIVLNPVKSETIRFTEDDLIIVLAED